MSVKRSQLRIFNSGNDRITITAEATRTTFAVEDSSDVAVTTKPLVVNTPLKLLHPDGVTYTDNVATKLNDIDAEFVTRATTASDATDAVQADLVLRSNQLNTAIGNLDAAITQEVADRKAEQVSDTIARNTMQATLSAAIDTEQVRATAAEGVNATNITALNNSLDSKAQTIQANLDGHVADINTQISFIKGTVNNTAAIDSIQELLNLVGGDPGSSILQMITGLQTSINTLKSVIDTLTNATTDLDAVPDPVYVKGLDITPFNFTSEAEIIAAGYANAVNNEAELVGLTISGTSFSTDSAAGIPIRYKAVDGFDAVLFEQYSTVNDGTTLRAYLVTKSKMEGANRAANFPTMVGTFDLS